jgi:PTH1 family peptidyl-tRNA hydrolase
MSNENKYDWLIVGLGNPGKIYENTRHNIGWMVLDYISDKFCAKITHQMYFNFFTMNIHECNVLYLKPNIFMNNSGESVKRVVDKYNIPSNKIVVICDEFNFPVGKIHLKKNGSDGGHNGIASIIEKLNTLEFNRLRCGIGNDFSSGQLVDYVLSEFLPEQKADVNKMIQKSGEAIEYIINFGIVQAMQNINSGLLFE